MSVTYLVSGFAMRNILSTLLVLTLATGGNLLAQYPTSNLLTDADFENGTVGWIYGTANAGTTPYGAPNSAPVTVGSALGGGNRHLQVRGWWWVGQALLSKVHQFVDVTPHAADIDQGLLSVRMSAWQGSDGPGSTNGALLVQFLDSSGNAVTLPGPTTWTGWRSNGHRNYENTMAYREGRWRVPPGTRSIRAEFSYSKSAASTSAAYADNASLILELTTVLPGPLPLDTNLLDNPGFERPRLINPGARLAGKPVEGWFVSGLGASPVGVQLYGTAGAPTQATATAIGGGSQFYYPAVVSRTVYVSQDIDLSGNLSLIQSGATYVDLDGFFGGSGPVTVPAKLEVEFFSPLGGTIAGGRFQIQGPTETQRNGETTMVYRFGRFPVPVGAGSMIVRVEAYGQSSAVSAIDNVSVQLRNTPPPSTVPLGLNLLNNASFETGPNQLVTPVGGWWTANSSFRVIHYGTTAIPFSTQTAAGGQQYLLTNAGTGSRYAMQSFDLRGHAATIDQGSLSLTLSGWFGGVGSDPDDASLRVVYRNEFGGPVGSLVNPAFNYDETARVLPADRSNQDDLVYRTSTFIVPPGVREVDVHLRVNHRSGPTNDAMADVVSAVLFDTGPTIALPGTDDDLELLTGVNSLPSGGGLEDVKTATAYDVLTVSVTSPQGTLNFAPLFLGVQAMPSGSAPTGVPGLPGIHLNIPSPNLFFVWNPLAPGLFPSVVVPGGRSLNIVVPPGLASLSLFWQAIALSPAAANNAYASTDTHEIIIQ